jgi:hypothetical protein
LSHAQNSGTLAVCEPSPRCPVTASSPSSATASPVPCCVSRPMLRRPPPPRVDGHVATSTVELASAVHFDFEASPSVVGMQFHRRLGGCGRAAVSPALVCARRPRAESPLSRYILDVTIFTTNSGGQLISISDYATQAENH